MHEKIESEKLNQSFNVFELTPYQQAPPQTSNMSTISTSKLTKYSNDSEPVTLDNLSWRLERARYWRKRMREEAVDFSEFGLDKKRFHRKTPKSACNYFNHYFLLELPNMPKSDDEASCMLFDLANLPTEMVRSRMEGQHCIKVL